MGSSLSVTWFSPHWSVIFPGFIILILISSFSSIEHPNRQNYSDPQPTNFEVHLTGVYVPCPFILSINQFRSKISFHWVINPCKISGKILSEIVEIASPFSPLTSSVPNCKINQFLARPFSPTLSEISGKIRVQSVNPLLILQLSNVDRCTSAINRFARVGELE